MNNTLMVTKSFALDQNSLDRLEKMAEKSDRSGSAMVRVIINDYFERNFSEIVSQKENSTIDC